MQDTNSNTIKWRIEQLEKNYDALNIKVDLILTNHLPHINAAIQSLETRINVATAINIGAIILLAAILKFL